MSEASSAPTPASAPPTTQRSADARNARRQSILEAAMDCFARDGFHGTSMQKICQEAGMSPGALYRYFPSKESLIAAIVSEERTERLHVFDTVTQAPAILPAMLETIAEILRDHSLPTARLGPEIMAEAIRNEPLRNAIEPVEQETRDMLRDMLHTAMARGEIAPELNLEDVLVMFQIMGDGVVLHHQLHPEWNMPDRMNRLGILIQRMLAPHQTKAQD
ncbi:MAG: TetR/AcrR family transcriptional regulator [Xanthobacter sp.]